MRILQKKCFKQFEGRLHYLPFDEGVMAEWLGTGLQNLLQRFNSASRLQFMIVS